MRLRAGLFVLVGIACGKTTSPPSPIATTPDVSARPTVEAHAPPLLPAPPKVVMTIRGPGELEVEGQADLLTALQIEVRDPNGAWEPLKPPTTFRLISSCDGEAAQCTKLSAGAPIRVVPWTGLAMSRQCGLGLSGTSGHLAASVRFTAKTCDGQHTLSSPSYDVPAMVHADATERIWASESVISVTAARLVGPVGNWEPKSPAEASKIAGLAVRAGTERTLDDEARAALSALLKDPRGFDDRIAKRCLMQNMMGFRITRTLATTGTEPKPQQIDLVIDTACSKIFVVRGDAARTVHASHYDPSRPGFLALVKRLFPDSK